MAKAITLDSEKREITGRKIRKEEERRIPAVMYGHGVENKNIWVDATNFLHVLAEVGESTIVKLKIDGKSVNVLIHDYQVDPILDNIIHIDFFQVRMDEEVITDVSLVFIGESPAVKSMGGTLTIIDSISVRALPGELPSEITVDISSLKDFDTSITCKDLKISDNVEILLEETQTIASVSAPRTQAELDATNEEVNADVSKVEGVSEKKEKEEKSE